MEARVGSGGQILSDGAMAGQHQPTMHTLQPVVDSGWPSLMSIDPSAATFVPSLNAAAMMMMMMPQAATPYPVMFASNQPGDKMSADGFSPTVGLTNVNVCSMSSQQQQQEPKPMDAGVSMNSYKQPAAPAASQTEGSKQSTAAAANYADRPKKPLSPYMRFSKQVWSSVKESHPNMSICEIGAVIGRMWRELSDSDKKYYVTEFEQEKTKYDEEIRTYLNDNGLKPSDLVKPKAQKKQPTTASSKKAAKANPSSQNGPVSTGLSWPQNSNENAANQRNVAGTAGGAVSAGNSHLTTTTATAANMGPNSDNMLVFHMSDDGTSGYYIQQRGQTIAELKSDGVAAATSSANQMMHVNSVQNSAAAAAHQQQQQQQQQQANVIAEQTQVIAQLKSALADAYQYIGQLQKELNMSRQMSDATQQLR